MSERCHGIRDKLSAFADGELSAADEERVRAHVTDCPACRDALAAIVLTDEAVATEDVSRPEEEWESLAARVDAAVARAHEQDLRAERTSHGWRHKKRGFLGGLLPAPIAFGSAGTIVAALLVVLLHGLLEERAPESGFITAEDMLQGRGAEREAAPDSSPPAPERLRALGYVDGGAAARNDEIPAVLGAAQESAPPAVREIAAKPETAATGGGRAGAEVGLAKGLVSTADRDASANEPAPDTAARQTKEEARASQPAAPPEAEPEKAALRPVEPELRIASPSGELAAPPESAAEVPEPASDEEGAVEEATPDTDSAIAAAESTSSESSALATASPEEDSRSLEDLARDYAQRRAATPPPPSPAIRDRPPPRARARPDAMSRALEEQRRETDQALSLALAREVYLFAQERREEGDVEGAIGALSLLLDNEHARIREQAWADLISLEGEKALEEGEVVEIARVASASDAFLREYPSSRFRLGVLKRRVRLWAEAVQHRPDLYCEPASAAAADWRSVIGPQADPENAASAERIRSACGR